MTTAHSSTTFQRTLRRDTEPARTLLRLQWSVSASALGRGGRSTVDVVLDVRDRGTASLMIDGTETDHARDWLGRWNGRVHTRRAVLSKGPEMLIVDASPLAVAVFELGQSPRPLHVSSDLPAVLGLAGGRYEIVEGTFSA